MSKNKKQAKELDLITDEHFKQKRSKSKKREETSYNVVGAFMLLVVASITYTTTIIIMGTEGILPLVMVVPQAIFGLIVLIKKFIK